jgi:hypothetical protein
VLVDGTAQDAVEALHIPPDRLRALLVAEAELGERIMRALIPRDDAVPAVLALLPFALYPLTKPTAMLLDAWLGEEGIAWLAERDIRTLSAAAPRVAATSGGWRRRERRIFSIWTTCRSPKKASRSTRRASSACRSQTSAA